MGDDGFGGGFGDAPNEGTLGGTMSDAFGENSATMGGSISDAQADANASIGFNDGMGFGLTDSFMDSMSDPSFTGTQNSMNFNQPTQEDTFFSKAIKGLLGFGKNAAVNAVAGKMGIPGIAMSMGKGALGAINAPNQNAANQSMAHGFQNGMMGMIGLPGLAAQGVMGLASAMGAPNQGMTGASSPTGGNSGSGMGSGGGFGQAMGGLASLYGYNQANKSMNQQAGGLAGMYGQDSPFAQGLRQQLERRDAAGGRRSQYGPREVELQAKLAQLMAGNAGQIGQIRGQQNQMRAQGLAQIIQMLNQSGASNAIGSGLQGLMNSGISSGVSSGFLPSNNSGMPDMSENPFEGLGEF